MKFSSENASAIQTSTTCDDDSKFGTKLFEEDHIKKYASNSSKFSTTNLFRTLHYQGQMIANTT